MGPALHVSSGYDAVLSHQARMPMKPERKGFRGSYMTCIISTCLIVISILISALCPCCYCLLFSICGRLISLEVGSAFVICLIASCWACFSWPIEKGNLICRARDENIMIKAWWSVTFEMHVAILLGIGLILTEIAVWLVPSLSSCWPLPAKPVEIFSQIANLILRLFDFSRYIFILRSM